MNNRKSKFIVPAGQEVSPDPILSLGAKFDADTRENKVNAGIGIYRGADGKTFTPNAVVEAAKKLPPVGRPDYIGPNGEGEYLGHIPFLEGAARIAFGQKQADELLTNGKLAAAGTPGGTGAIELIASWIKKYSPDSTIVVGTPTWPNHINIPKSKGIKINEFNHIKNNAFNMEAQLKAIEESPEDSIIILHAGKTHNSTGTNPQTPEEWRTIAKALNGRRAFLDAPYVGFSDGLEQDTEAIRIFMDEGIDMAVAVSFAKNGGLYKERPGALFIPTDTKENALQLQRSLNALARLGYSSPPARGEEVMAGVFSNPDLFNEWKNELSIAADDLKSRRAAFVRELPEFEFVTKQAGLFSMLPLSKEQVKLLQEKHGVYMPASGRVNFGGILEAEIPVFTAAIRDVLKQ